MDTFQVVGRERLTKTSARRGETTQGRVVSWLEKNIFPAISHIPMADLRARDVLDAMRIIEQCGTIDSAKRVLGYCDQIFQFAIATEAVTVDVTAGLYRALETKQQHYAAVTSPAQADALLRSIDASTGIRSLPPRCASPRRCSCAPASFEQQNVQRST